MNEQEALIFIQHAMKQSKNVLAELLLLEPKVFAIKSKTLGEYYSNLENCKKEIQSCEVAIKALEEVQKYRAIGTPEECRAAMERMKPKKPIISSRWSPAICPNCKQILSESKGDGYWQHYTSLQWCDCGQNLDWSE